MTDPFAPQNLTIDPNRPQSYLGKGLAWPFEEDPATGDFRRSVGYQNINQCLIHLIQISFYDVPGIETMGTNADRLLFDNDPQASTDLFRRSIIRAVKIHETRVVLQDVGFEWQPVGNLKAGRYVLGIRLRYRIKSNGDVVTNVFPFDSIVVSGDVS